MSRLDEIRQERINKVDRLTENGIDPYPSFAGERMVIGEARGKLGEKVAVVGRIMAQRGHGKLIFVDLQDASDQIQLMLKADMLGEDLFKIVHLLDIGDFIWAEGVVAKSKTGEMSVLVEKTKLLTKSLRPLPEKWHGLSDVEERYRQRYIDLLVNQEVRQVFITRTKVVRFLRGYLDEKGFIEVETPVLQPVYGGAAAQPFTTHHQALDCDLYLRISDELYLKRLLVGGFEKVYEMSKDFRNEGLSREHNPEFTMLEFYWAYADYEMLMEFTEQMLTELVKNVKNSIKVIHQGNEYDFSLPWERVTYRNLLIKHLEIDIDQVTGEQELLNLVKSRKLLEEGDLVGYAGILDKLYKHHIRPKLAGPMFVTDYPTEMLPLAKRKDADKSKIASFQLVIGGSEFIKAYNELNDPQEQRRRWEEEISLAKKGYVEHQMVDEDYIRALEYGMPPTAGWGMGIDRLVAFLTDQPTLKDVILFPTLRPE